ncbi:MAG: EAL domain-containing protein [Actinomycetota bacterium]|nr:EAL domain-containing protein [Actinomycetota bacterium]
MRLSPWLTVLVAGTVLALLSTPLGEDVQGLTLLVTGAASVLAIRVGVRRWRPSERAPWSLLGLAVGLFMVAAVAREIELALRGGTEVYPSLPDALDAIAYLIAIVGVHLLARLRAHRRDPTNLIDAVIVAGGVGVIVWVSVMVPYLQDPTRPVAGRAVDVAFSALSLTLFAVTAHLAIGPGAKSPSYYLLAVSVSGALLTDVLVSLQQASDVAFAGEGALVLFLPTLSFVALGAGALHPSMVELTTRTTVPLGRMTTGRLVMTTVTVLLPPATLLVKAHRGSLEYAEGLVVCWIVISVLVMVRLAGLVRARERMALLERTLRDAAASLVVATDRDQMYRAALDATHQLVPHVPELRVAVVTFTNGQWSLAAASGYRADDAVAAGVDGPRLEAALPASSRTPVRLVDVPALDLPDGAATSVALTPLVSQGQLRGALLVSAARPFDQDGVDALEGLAAHVSLALEGAARSEDLHRRRSERRFRALVEHSGDIVLVMTDEHSVTFASPAAERLLGHSAETLAAAPLEHVIVPEDRPLFTRAMARATRLAAASNEPFELRVLDAEGRPRWFEAAIFDLRHEPEVDGIVVNAREVTQRKRAEADLGHSEARFRSLVQHSSDMVALLDRRNDVTYVSPSSERVLGYLPEELLGAGLAGIIHPEDRAVIGGLLSLLVPSAAGPSSTELRVRDAAGAWKTLDVTITDLRSEPAVGGIVLNAHDVTDRKILEHDLRQQVLHDDLTGLANRVLLQERLEHALSRQGRGGEGITVLFIDLDDFKTVNDGLGHGVGDELLKEIASRLSSLVRGADTVARFGGDEFAVLLEDAGTTELAVETAKRLLVAIREPVEFGDRRIAIGASVGIAMSSDAVTASDVILRNADVAMYYAKRTGKGRVKVFAEAMYLSAFERLELKADLTEAVAQQQLSLEYQPLLSLSGGEVVGFEALLRWHHPRMGAVSPASFIPLAEETGLIVPIGAWVLRQACAQLRQWRERWPERSLTMSVNVSPRQLEEEGVVSDVARILRETEVEPDWLTVELTESIFVDEGASRVHLCELGELGIGIAADDFGSGFASYAALQQLPFSTVKIDRSLIDGLTSGPGKAAVQVRSIIEMAHATGLSVVGEGIETEEQLDTLTALGCDLGQGYLLGWPASAAATEELLRAASPTEALGARR